MRDVERAVIEAAKAWRVGECITADQSGEREYDLGTAVDALNEADRPNEPTGPVEQRRWAEIPAGWFVQTPRGVWLEVVSTRLRGRVQEVELQVGPASTVTYPRDPAQQVPCRRGTRDRAVTGALEALGSYTVLEDGS